MCDPEQRAEEHKEYLAHKHRPAIMNCDQCTRLMPRQTITENWKDTGWNVCEFCVDDLPDFVLEYIDLLNARISDLGRLM